MSRRRVLQIIQNLNYGGMERLLADIVRTLDREKFESHVLALGYLGRFSEGLEPYATLHVAEPMPKWSLLAPVGLTRQIRAIAPDVVHLHSGVWYKASLASRRAGVGRILFTEHGRSHREPWLARMLDARAARRTDLVVAVSESVAERLRDGIVSPRVRLAVVENGIDTGRFVPREDNGAVRREFGIEAGRPILGSIGRLEHIKGYDIMIEAFALLRETWSGSPPPVLLVGGDGSERARCQAIAAARGVGGDVFLPGWRDDVHDLLASFNLFTMSSRSEGTSVSLLEAMSAGLCPVVTDVGGNRAVLGEDLAHRVVVPEAPAALSRAWRDALVDRDRCRADGLRGRTRVQERFSLTRMVSEYARFYTGV